MHDCAADSAAQTVEKQTNILKISSVFRFLAVIRNPTTRVSRALRVVVTEVTVSQSVDCCSYSVR